MASPTAAVVDPAAADHGRDDLDRLQLVGRGLERIAGENDEVGEIARKELPAPALVAGQPGRVDDARNERLFDRQALLGMPGRPLVDRPSHAGADPRERIQLFDGGVRAVRDERPRLPQRAKRVRAVGLLGPETLGEVAIGRGVAELHRARDAESCEPADLLGRKTLRVLDSMPQTERRPHVAGRLERIERLSVRSVADCVHADGPAQARALRG